MTKHPGLVFVPIPAKIKTAAVSKQPPFVISGSPAEAGSPDYMWAMMLSPNAEHLISVAPSMRRAKS